MIVSILVGILCAEIGFIAGWVLFDKIFHQPMKRELTATAKAMIKQLEVLKSSMEMLGEVEVMLREIDAVIPTGVERQADGSILSPIQPKHE